jgi:hypothetical protein
MFNSLGRMLKDKQFDKTSAKLAIGWVEMLQEKVSLNMDNLVDLALAWHDLKYRTKK